MIHSLMATNTGGLYPMAWPQQVGAPFGCAVLSGRALRWADLRAMQMTEAGRFGDDNASFSKWGKP